MSESLIDGNELREAIRSSDALEALIGTWGLDEVRLAMVETSQQISKQLQLNRDEDPHWRHRAVHMLKRTEALSRVLKLRISERNREESATVEAAERKWAVFAESVARALYLLSPEALRAVPGPDHGDITAEEWLHLRIEQRARKQAAS
jgi:hypothetical protein